MCQDREVKQQKYYQEDKNSVKVQPTDGKYIAEHCNGNAILGSHCLGSPSSLKNMPMNETCFSTEKKKHNRPTYHQQRLAIYEGGLDVMANYRAENAIWDTMEWPDFASMSREKLRAYLRELQVRYDGQQKIVQDCLDNMRKQIQKLLRDERLSEAFFRSSC